MKGRKRRGRKELVVAIISPEEDVPRLRLHLCGSLKPFMDLRKERKCWVGSVHLKYVH